MPQFYFNLRNGAECVEDEEGVDLTDHAAARHNAIRSLRGILAGDLMRGELNTACIIEIVDERRELVRTVSFAEAVTLRHEPYIRAGGK